MPTALENRVKEIFGEQERAWNAGDGNAWSADFDVDADFINIRGTLFKGRTEIAKRHSAILSSFFRGSRDKVIVQSIAWLTPDVAIVRVTHDVTGHSSPPPGIHDTEPGRLITRMTCVLRCAADSTCEIVFAQNTALVNKEEQ